MALRPFSSREIFHPPREGPLTSRTSRTPLCLNLVLLIHQGRAPGHFARKLLLLVFEWAKWGWINTVGVFDGAMHPAQPPKVGSCLTLKWMLWLGASMKWTLEIRFSNLVAAFCLSIPLVIPRSVTSFIQDGLLQSSYSDTVGKGYIAVCYHKLKANLSDR